MGVVGMVLLGCLSYTFFVAAAYLIATRDKTKISEIHDKFNWISNRCIELNHNKVSTAQLLQSQEGILKMNEANQKLLESLKQKIEWLEMKLNAKEQSLKINVPKIIVKNVREAVRKQSARA